MRNTTQKDVCRRKKCTKPVVMGSIYLQEWRAHNCSQTAAISKLVVMPPPRGGCPDPISEISTLLCIHRERAPMWALHPQLGVSVTQLRTQSTPVSKELIELNSFHSLSMSCLTRVPRDETATRQLTSCTCGQALLGSGLCAHRASMARWNGNIW